MKNYLNELNLKRQTSILMLNKNFYQSELCIQFKILTMISVSGIQSHFVFLQYYIWKHSIQECCLTKQWLEGYWAFGILFP